MSSTREKKLLFLFAGVFSVITLLLVWQFYFQATSFFQAGSRPAVADQQEAKPIMPPIRESDPARGGSGEDAVTIVEYADFTCVYCRAVESEIVSVLNKNPEVRHIWRDMPVASDTPKAMIASVAGRCAQDQGKFWDMHYLLLGAEQITLDRVSEFAKQIKLNQTTFTSCMSSNKHVLELQEDISIARDHGITSAPTLFIGNEVISGFATASEIRWAVLRAKWSN